MKIIFFLTFMAMILSIWTIFVEPGRLTVAREKIRNWPSKPLKLIFFSDLHMGAPHITAKYVRNLVGKINSEKPDLILLGGDFVIDNVVGGHIVAIEEIALILKDLKAPLGVFAVLGNHDWWNDGFGIRQALEKQNMIVLENKAVKIQNESGVNFWLVGIGDHSTKHSDLNAAMAQVTGTDPTILFLHNPAPLKQMEQAFNVALAGHMHRGQINLPLLGPIITPGKAPRSWSRGWTNLKHGPLFVSKGIGTSILPIRFNASPEYVVLELAP